MNKKLTVAEFARLVGTSPKTVYDRISLGDKLPINEQLITLRETIKGRSIQIISTSDEQISQYRAIFNKNIVNEGEYYETVTVNNGNDTEKGINYTSKTYKNPDFGENLIKQFITVNNELNSRYEEKVNELLSLSKELGEIKGRQLLLEDKASREGLYIKEINELKDSNKQLINYQKFSITVIISLIIVILILFTFIITFFLIKNTENEGNNESKNILKQEQVISVPENGIKNEVKAKPQPHKK